MAEVYSLRKSKKMEVGFLWKNHLELEDAKKIPNLKDIIDETDDEDNLALFASVVKHPDTFCYFIDCGANIYAKFGGSPLLNYAVYIRAPIKCIEKLLSAGAYIHSRDDEGNTPLHTSLDEDRFITSFLVQHNADVNAFNYNDETPLDCVLYPYYIEYCDDTLLDYVKPVILAGGYLNKVRKESTPPWYQIFVEKLGACKSASIALKISLRKHRVSKDIIPIIEKMVFETHEDVVWELLEEE